MYNQIFFTNVLRLLDERNMTKSVLAEKAGISVSFLSDLTNDKANPSLKIMDAIARAFDVELPMLLDSTDLDSATLAALMERRVGLAQPDGYVRLAVVLTPLQAFTARRWDVENRKRLKG